MKLKLFIILLALSLLSCKKKSEDNPTPTNTDGTNTVPIEACNNVWTVYKQSVDTVEFRNGYLRILSAYGKKHTTSLNSSCELVGDFELKVEVPYLSLSDSANKGQLFLQLYSMSDTTVLVTSLLKDLAFFYRNTKSATMITKFISSKPTKATFSYKRTGASLYAKLTYVGDSLETTISNFTSRPLNLQMGALTDTLGKMPTEVRIEKIVVTGGSGLKTDELNSGTLITR